MTGPDDLVPLSDDVPPAGFDVVFARGYDRRQVEDYVERVEVALEEAEARHAEDVARLSAGEKQFHALREQLADAEARAAGLPESATRIGERLAQMLALAEQEAAEIRGRAQAEAQAALDQGRTALDAETAARTEALEQRERDIAGAGEQADQLRLQAQEDARTVREAAQRDADAVLGQAQQHAQATVEQARREAGAMVEQARAHAAAQREQADEDVRQLHDAAREEAASMTHEARRQVRELSAQRDTIAAQLQSLRDTLSGAVGPLSAGPEGDERVSERGGSVRTSGPDRG